VSPGDEEHEQREQPECGTRDTESGGGSLMREPLLGKKIGAPPSPVAAESRLRIGDAGAPMTVHPTLVDYRNDHREGARDR
jgi:hypothetical protein